MSILNLLWLEMIDLAILSFSQKWIVICGDGHGCLLGQLVRHRERTK